MDNKEIVVKSERMKKLLGWFEEKTKPIQALVMTVAIFVLIGLVTLLGFVGYFIFGYLGVLIIAAFLLFYILVLAALL